MKNLKPGLKIPSIDDWGIWGMLSNYHQALESDEELMKDMVKYRQILVQLEEISSINFSILEGMMDGCMKECEKRFGDIDDLNLQDRIKEAIKQVDEMEGKNQKHLPSLRVSRAREVMEELNYLIGHPLYSQVHDNGK